MDFFVDESFMVLRYSRFYEFQRVGLSMSVFINCERFKFKIAEMMDIHICLAQKSPKLLRSWKKVKSVMILYGFLTLFRFLKTCRRKKNFYINKIFCLISRKLLDVKKIKHVYLSVNCQSKVIISHVLHVGIWKGQRSKIWS